METTRAAATQTLRFVCEQCRTAYAATSLEVGKAYRCRRCGHSTRYRGPTSGSTSAPGADGSTHGTHASDFQATVVSAVPSPLEVTPPVGEPAHLSAINLDPAEDSAFINIPDDPADAVSSSDPPRAADPPSTVPPPPESRDWLMSSFDQDERPTAPADSIPRPAAHTATPDRGLPTLASGITPLVAPKPSAEAAPAPAAPPSPRRTFGPYEIVAEIGRGGMGVVYKARDPKLDRFVAIKTLIGGHASNQSAIKRFEREARTIARLNHPAIVPIHEYGEVDGTRYLVMEFVEGRTLVDLAKGERGNTRASLMLMSKVARALAYAHGEGIVHRDLKPANIMVDARREPRVMDFGLAKDLDSSQSLLSQTGDLMGTPNYMAPEQADGRIHEVDQLSDVFSMGAILYELLAGSPPFHGASLAETLRQVLFEDPPPMRTLNPKVDPELERITLKALEKARDARYPSAAALADDLDRFLQGQEISVAAPSVLTRVTKTVKRRRGWARGAAVATLAVAALAGGAAFLLRDPLGGTRERLSSRDAEVRQRAIETLATDRKTGRLAESKRAAPAFELVTQALGDASLGVQLAATRSLPDWREILPPTAEREREALARTLEANLEIDAPTELRIATLDAVEALRLAEAQEALTFMVTDLREDQDVQLRAVRTLGAIGKLSAFPALMQVMNRGGVYRVEAQAAIDRLATPRQPGAALGAPDGDKVGLGDLPAAIRGFEKDVAGNRAREMEALESLGMAPSPTRQSDSLRQTLEQGSATQRLNAVYQISQRRIPGAEKLLLGAISDIDSSVAQAAATALASIAGKSCRDELEGVLKTGGARARAAAAMGLAELALPESLDPLIVALGNETDASAMVELMKALAALGDRRAAPHLVEKLSSADPRVSRTAHSALTRLAGQDLGDSAGDWRAWAAAG